MLELSFFLNQVGFFSQSLSPKLSSGLCCQNSQNYQNAIWICSEYCSHALGCCSQLLLGFFIICNLAASQPTLAFAKEAAFLPDVSHYIQFQRLFIQYIHQISQKNNTSNLDTHIYVCMSEGKNIFFGKFKLDPFYQLCC